MGARVERRQGAGREHRQGSLLFTLPGIGARPGLMTQVSWDQTSMPEMSRHLTSMLRNDGR